jgi:PAS domain S-box-containing protein
MAKKILVVDDDRVILKFATKLLQREGHEVVTAEDGFAALNLLTSFTPDIMFFDLIMPKIGGEKLIQLVRKMSHLKDCYLVIVSAAVAEIDFNFESTGADSYIAKGPFNKMADHFLAAIEAAAVPLQKDQPKPIRGLDTVYARRMTKELLSRNRHLEAILESMSEGILELYSGRIVYANAVALSLFGLPQEKLIAAYPPDLFDAKIRGQLEALLTSDLEEMIEIGENTPVELNTRQITIKKLPIISDLSTVILMITDVTDRKRLEMQLQHIQKMEAIGTIASGVAHNFRNTLTEILVNSQVLQMKFKAVAGLPEITERINTSVKRGARLVDGLLQFSHKQIKEEFKPFDLSEVIKGSYELIRTSFDQKIDIRIELSVSLPIMGDPSGLSQALMNLCTNARDAMPDGGILSIEAKQAGEMAVVVIADTGEGMDAETIEKCFDPFFTMKPIGKGTGMGLSTTYGIIKSHDGLIKVDSETGKGSVFTIRLPLVKDPQTIKDKPRPKLVRGNGQLVLVVDDEPEILKAMQDLLGGIGYRSALAACGRDALALYNAEKPDVVLMDINMPGMDGLECSAQIKNEDPDAKIAILSGYEQDKEKMADLFENNVIQGYLTKPVEMVDLSAVVDKLLKAGKQ